jgi:hypothetical protein
MIHERSAADDSLGHSGGQERDIGQPQPVDWQQVITLRRIKRDQKRIELLDEPANVGMRRIVGGDGELVHKYQPERRSERSPQRTGHGLWGTAFRLTVENSKLFVMSINVLAAWHQVARTCDVAGLDALLAENATFYSPVVHTPQVGKAITKKYLAAAFQVFFNESFRYVRELRGDHDAVLEFELELEGIKVNGVDLIKWNDEGKIVEFKVMLRPLKAVNLIHQKMGGQLEAKP